MNPTHQDHTWAASFQREGAEYDLEGKKGMKRRKKKVRGGKEEEP